jgi:CoA:oxalate CoA-transferase
VKGALSGVRVVDLSEDVAGPYCTKLFVGLRAEVIKVERPGTGDPARQTAASPSGTSDLDTSPLFLYLNTGKQSITLDITQKTGRRVLDDLIAGADVLVESYPPRTADELGLAAERLWQVNPRLVVTSVTNFGRTGPYRDYTADEITLLAMGGILFMTGEPDEPPLKMGGMLAQYCAGQNAFAGSMLALFARRRTGAGQHVDISIMETVMGILEGALTEWSFHQEVRGRSGTAATAGWGIYPCKNGFVAVVSGPRDSFKKLALLIGQPQLADPKYDSQVGRAMYKDEIEAMILAWLADHTKEETFERAQALHLPFGYLCTPEDLLRSPHLEERSFFVDLDHPAAGTLRYPGAPYKLSATPVRYERAPRLGEHNEAIYRDRLGYGEEDLGRLRERNVI